MAALSLKDANTRFALLKAFADAIYAEIADNREIHTARLVERYIEDNGKSFDVRLATGEKVASITLTIPKPTTAVTDVEAFNNWCLDNHPDALRLIPGTSAVVIPSTPSRYEVDPKAVTTILAGVRPGDDGSVVDADGVVVEGVTYTKASLPKQFSVRYEADGRDALALAYRRGLLNDLDPVPRCPRSKPPPPRTERPPDDHHRHHHPAHHQHHGRGQPRTEHAQ